LELVLKLDLLGDGDTVLGDARRAERLVEHDIAAFGAECYAHRVGENVDPVHHFVTGIDREFHFLGSHVVLLKFDCVASLRGSSAVFCEASPEGSVRGRDAPWPKDQAAFLEPPASTSTPIKSLSFMIMYSTPSSLTSVPDHLPNSTRSPTLTSIGMSLPLSSRPPGPTAMTSPS